MSDLADIEQHLKVIDREDSIAQIKTHGTPRIVPLKHQRAEVVASVIRDAYTGRIAASDKQRQQAATAQDSRRENRPSNPRDQRNPASRDQLAPPAPPVDASNQSEPPQMTLAIDGQSNALIVTAPTQLADEVEALARQVDRRGAQAIRVIPLKSISTARVHESLQHLFGQQIRSGSAARGPADRRSNASLTTN